MKNSSCSGTSVSGQRKRKRKKQEHREACSRCGRMQPVAMRIRKSKKPVCRSCYRKYYYDPLFEMCGDCGLEAEVKQRLADGRGICGRCKYLRYRENNQANCSECGRKRYVAKRIGHDRRPLCGTCNSKFYKQPRRVCHFCRKRKVVADRVGPQKFSRCHSCYHASQEKPRGVCCICKEEKNLPYVKDTERMCSTCYRKNVPPVVETCSTCDREKPVYTRNEEDKAICKNCWRKKHFKRCTFCSKRKIVDENQRCRKHPLVPMMVFDDDD